MYMFKKWEEGGKKFGILAEKGYNDNNISWGLRVGDSVFINYGALRPLSKSKAQEHRVKLWASYFIFLAQLRLSPLLSSPPHQLTFHNLMGSEWQYPVISGLKNPKNYVHAFKYAIEINVVKLSQSKSAPVSRFSSFAFCWTRKLMNEKLNNTS